MDGSFIAPFCEMSDGTLLELFRHTSELDPRIILQRFFEMSFIDLLILRVRCEICRTQWVNFARMDSPAHEMYSEVVRNSMILNKYTLAEGYLFYRSADSVSCL